MKSNYLNSLEREFYFVSLEEREQIIAEYEVHFNERIKDGATVEEVIDGLGTPKSVAIEYATELDIKYSTIEKHIANTKRDSNLYLKGLKRRFLEIKNEEAARRKNNAKYVKEFDRENSSDDSDYARDKPLEEKRLRKSSSRLLKPFTLIFALLFAIKSILAYVFKLFVKFTLFIIGIGFAIIALCGMASAIFLPIFLTFIGYKIQIWLIIYGTIASSVVFFATISLMCLARFGRINE